MIEFTKKDDKGKDDKAKDVIGGDDKGEPRRNEFTYV